MTRWYATGTDIDDRVKAEERTRNENLALREQIDRDSMFEDIVGSSESLRKVLRQVAKVAPSDSTVLILGETGTGKELIARAIHKRSGRRGRAFIGVSCAAIPAVADFFRTLRVTRKARSPAQRSGESGVLNPRTAGPFF